MSTVRGRLLTSGGEEFAVFTISRTASLLGGRQAIRYCELSSGTDGALNSNPLEYYLGSNAAAERLRAVCEQYAALDAPVLIEGDYGTGQEPQPSAPQPARPRGYRAPHGKGLGASARGRPLAACRYRLDDLSPPP